MLSLVIFLAIVSVIDGELCRETVCEFELMIHTARTMVYYNQTSGKSYEAELDGTDLALRETLFVKKESRPGLVGMRVPLDDVITGDGVRRDVIAINGQFPGPTIEVMEGSEIVIKVINHMMTDAVILHWHGIHQYKTPFMDGTAGVTQCPIFPEQSFTYRFKANPPGTHWYHPHLHYQRADGGYGMIIIHKTEPKLPQHTLSVTDWFHEPFSSLGQANPYNTLKGTGGLDTFGDYDSERMFSLEMVEQSAVRYQSALINGRGRSAGFEKLPLKMFTVNSGKKYLFRMASFAAEFSYKLSIDQHNMTVVALDGQDIEPIADISSVIITPGERIDVEISADQDPAQYWIRAEGLAEYRGHYGARIGETLGVKAVLAYDGHNDRQVDPEDKRDSCTTTHPCMVYGCPWENYPDGENKICIGLEDVKGMEEMPGELKNVEEEAFLNFEFVIGSSINGRKYISPEGHLFGKRTDEIEGRCLDSECTSGCKCTHVYDIPLGKNVQLVLTNRNENSMANTPHTVHIHGYQFYILKVGYAPQNLSTGIRSGINNDLKCADKLCTDQEWVNTPDDLNLVNPPLKDTILIPAGGYVVVRFKTFNPGYWLFHCHQATHHAEGMTMVINVGDGHHPPLPEGFPSCNRYEFTDKQYTNYMSDNWDKDDRDPDENRTKKKAEEETQLCENGKDAENSDRLSVSKGEAIGVCVGIGIAGIILGIIAAAVCIHRARASEPKPYSVST